MYRSSHFLKILGTVFDQSSKYIKTNMNWMIQNDIFYIPQFKIVFHYEKKTKQLLQNYIFMNFLEKYIARKL